MLTKRVSGIAAFTDMVDLKVYLSAEEFRAIGADIGDKAGALGHVRLNAFEWDAWREGDPDTFPRVFGTLSFTLEGAEFVPNKDPLKDGFWRLLGFCPAGIASGTAMYPEFARLPKVEKRDAAQPQTPAGF